VPGARQVLTIHDMIHEIFPRAARANPLIARCKALSARRADHVFCDSANTLRDVLERYGIDERRVSVVPLGYDDLRPLAGPETAAEFRMRALGADTPYLLYVGVRRGYKNFAGLLQAYAASASLRAQCMLLCFGGGGFSPDEHAAIAAAGVAARVRQIGGSDGVLADCYRHAALFVYPSLYEGFGIPPLEAMSLDCPVACADNSSLPEVVGDAAALFDAADGDSIRTVLESVVDSAALSAALVERGRARCRLFSWRRCAATLVATYRTLLAT
jgi:glycosyltransferase involved in cell wall biosynthesis